MTAPGSARHRLVAAATVALLTTTSACGGSDPPEATTTSSMAPEVEPTTTTTVPERPASTTTTAFDPTTVEGQVEAAYLKSWDVYADAVYSLKLDEEALASVFSGEALQLRQREIERRVSERRAALVELRHEYQVSVRGDSADVIDYFVNHQRLIDPESKRVIEPDPNERLLVHFRLRRTGSDWTVAYIEKVEA